MPTVKQISIKSATSATGYDTREIGAEALNVEVQYDASGNIITDLSTQTPDPSKTESLAEVLDNKAPKGHADTTTKYGAASQTEYGHVKIGAGLDVTNGEVSIKYGAIAGTAVEGNDTRLSDDRKNPNALSFADGTSYDGSVAESIDADSVGAAVKNHASATDEFGAGTQTMFGHVKVSDVYNTDLGTASTSLAASQHAIYEVYQEAIRGSGSAGRELTKAEYDALTPDEKSDGTIYFITDWNQSGGGGATATDISFDDEVTQLDVANVQNAIEKLTDARNITFNNGLTGIEATNVQDAIDYAIENGGGSGDGVGGSLFSIYSDVFTNNPVQAVVIHADTDHGDYDGEESKVVVFKPTTDPNEQAFGAYKASLYFEAVGEIEIRVYSLDRSEILKTKTVGAHTYNHYLVKMDSNYFKDVLVAAGYSVSDYANLTDLFADEIATRKVMTLHASVDALFNWGHDHETEENFDSLFDNDIAMKWLGLRDYACDKFMSYEPFKTKMLESQYWERILKDHVPVMTSNTAPYGEASASSVYDKFYAYRAFDSATDTSWICTQDEQNSYIQYKFTNPINIKRVLYRLNKEYSGIANTNVIVSASNDGVNFTMLKEMNIELPDNTSINYIIKLPENDAYYMYYRLTFGKLFISGSYNCGVSNLQFYGRSLNVSVPTMTSNTAPWGEITSSTPHEPYYAYNPFSGTGPFISYENTLPSDYFIAYRFTRPINAKMMSIQLKETNKDVTYKFIVQYYNDKLGTWSNCSDEITYVTSGSMQVFNIKLTDSVSEKYRIKGTYSSNGYFHVYGHNSFAIYGLQFYGVDYSEREFAEGSTMKYLYDHGVELEEIKSNVTNGSLVNKETDCICLQANTGDSLANIYTNNTDITPYSLARMTIGNRYKEDDYAIIGVSVDGSSDAIPLAYSNIKGQELPRNIYCNVSSVNQSANNKIKATVGGIITVAEWWLE